MGGRDHGRRISVEACRLLGTGYHRWAIAHDRLLVPDQPGALSLPLVPLTGEHSNRSRHSEHSPRNEESPFRAEQKGIGSFEFAKDFRKGALPWDSWNASVL